jgi:2-polyprenyl-6-methoxyphenol hydroxylase-like FAD-dependent oxidoreductase
MNAISAINETQLSGPAFDHAIVIGSSIAGLSVARVLTDHFTRVTIIDRDHLPTEPQFRRGTPQARHGHILPLRGQALLEQQFPGLFDELVANGAISINGGSEMAFFIAGGWHQVRHHAAVVSTSCSRPLLETAMYRRLATHTGVNIIQGYEVVGLRIDKWGQRATGVRLRSRSKRYSNETNLAADLVVDTSGRGSQAPQWLASLGYPSPQETRVNSFPGYATRIYQRPIGLNESWKTMYIKPTPPDGTRGGLIIPIEGDRWQVTLVGMARDYPPTDEEGFLTFARSLPTQRLYEAIKETKPLSKPYGYRHTENRLRHYDRLPCYLEGFLVSGDAVCALNPVYAQGMTVAAMSSLALDHCLKSLRQRQAVNDMIGLASAFQKQLNKVVAGPWQMAIREDRRWPSTETAEQQFVPVRHRLPSLQFNPVPVPTRYSIAYQ